MTNKRTVCWHRSEKTGQHFLHEWDGADYFHQGVKCVPAGEPFEVEGPPEPLRDGLYLVSAYLIPGVSAFQCTNSVMHTVGNPQKLMGPMFSIVSKPIELLPGVTL